MRDLLKHLDTNASISADDIADDVADEYRYQFLAKAREHCEICTFHVFLL